MSKKVFELANEFGIGAVDLVEQLRSIGLNVRNHMVLLTDEELATANEKLGTATVKKDEAKAAKKVVKKVAKKSVVKKVAKDKEEPVIIEAPVEKTEVSAESTAVPEAKAEVAATATVEAVEAKDATDAGAENADEKKSRVIKRKAGDLKKKSIHDKDETNEDGVYKERMHSFTPIFVPEKTEDDSDDQVVKRGVPLNLDGTASTDDEDADRKKRFGGLAAMVNKKAVVGKAKDVTMLRAEEEMKFASGVVGKAIYTPAARKKVYVGLTKSTEITEVKEQKRVINLHDGATALEISQKLSQKFSAFADKCLQINLLVAEEDYIGIKLATQIANLYNYRVENRAFNEEDSLNVDTKINEGHPLRNPIITIMGHVDHGKTSLLDYIRKEKVASGEAGGITQHIGAYSVMSGNTTITFLDTPGHAAFGNMRQRGANVTDIVVLVVAADDGVMPQTKESIKYAQNAKCPIIVAINKCDKPGANPEKVKQGLLEFGLTAEEWGGDTQMVPVSALTGEGIDALLASIKIQAEVMELRANPQGGAEGIVIESKIEPGRGAVSTVLIQTGTLKKGESIVVGNTSGRARSLMDYTGKSIESAGPSIPVQILGLDDVASPGDKLNVAKNEREAKKVVENRLTEMKAIAEASKKKVRSLDDFFGDVATTESKKVLNLIVRADMIGSYEAIVNSLESLGNTEVSVEVLSGGVGAITENDVQMAHSSKGYIIGFNMRPVTNARRMAEELGIEIKNYSIIYQLIDDITAALEGMLAPEYKEVYIGRAEVRNTFSIPKLGLIAGSSVIDGKIAKGCQVRLLRDGKIMFDGKLSSLKRFKDDVKEVKNGFECGVGLEGFTDVRVNDIFEAYIMEETKRKLEPSNTVTL